MKLVGKTASATILGLGASWATLSFGLSSPTHTVVPAGECPEFCADTWTVCEEPDNKCCIDFMMTKSKTPGNSDDPCSPGNTCLPCKGSVKFDLDWARCDHPEDVAFDSFGPEASGGGGSTFHSLTYRLETLCEATGPLIKMDVTDGQRPECTDSGSARLQCGCP